MLKKTIVFILLIFGFCYFAHTQIEKSRYPALRNENISLADKVDSLTTSLAKANKSKDAVTVEYNKAVDELNQIKALAKAASTRPSVIKN